MPPTLYAFMSCTETALLLQLLAAVSRSVTDKTGFPTCAAPLISCTFLWDVRTCTLSKILSFGAKYYFCLQGVLKLKARGASVMSENFCRVILYAGRRHSSWSVPWRQTSLSFLGLCLRRWPCSFMTNKRINISKLFAVPTSPKIYAFCFDNFNLSMNVKTKIYWPK